MTEQAQKPCVVRLKWATVLIHEPERWVRTELYSPCGFRGRCLGTREPNEQNLREARDQGYAGDDPAWRSLIDHEVLHSLLGERLFDGCSPALLTAAGIDPPQPYFLRLYEESIALACQLWLNTGCVEAPLEPF